LRRRDPHPFRYTDLPDPQPAKIVVEQGAGRILGYERSDGTFVAAGEPCCSDPTLATFPLIGCTVMWAHRFGDA
jgi:hypothetical protein